MISDGVNALGLKRKGTSNNPWWFHSHEQSQRPHYSQLLRCGFLNVSTGFLNFKKVSSIYSNGILFSLMFKSGNTKVSIQKIALMPVLDGTSQALYATTALTALKTPHNVKVFK
jgi:hypothetical protein